MLIRPNPITNMDAIGNSCFWLVNFKKSSALKPLSQMNWNLLASIYKRGSVLSFLKAEWKVSDTGSAHWASSNYLFVMENIS